jgi:hypothetical protein
MLSREKFDRTGPKSARRNEVTLEIREELFSEGVIDGLVQNLLVPLTIDEVIRQAFQR